MRVSLIDLVEHQRLFKLHGKSFSYPKGQLFSNPEDTHPWVYYIESGIVKVSFSLEDGAERLIGFFVTDMMFAQSGVFYNADSGRVSYTTMVPTKVFRMAREDYLKLVQKNAAFRNEYMQCILHNQSFLVDRIVYQAEPNVEKKFLRWVLFMLKYYGPKDDGPPTILLRVTQDVIANFLHVSREAVNKAMMKYIKMGIISVDKKHITVTNMDCLNGVLNDAATE